MAAHQGWPLGRPIPLPERVPKTSGYVWALRLAERVAAQVEIRARLAGEWASARLVPVRDPEIYDWADKQRRRADYLLAHPDELAAYRQGLDGRKRARTGSADGG